jgi:predicted metal-dependent hydrolase
MAVSRTINLGGIGPVLLERSERARRISMTVDPARRIRVAVPRGVPFAAAEAFARQKTGWLEKVLRRIHARRVSQRDFAGELRRLDTAAARKTLRRRLAQMAREHGYPYRGVTVRSQKTRWGSCSARNDISLNIKLALLPAHYRDYVILHELVHTRYHNHGPAFWKELDRHVPGARQVARRLREEYDLRLM